MGRARPRGAPVMQRRSGSPPEAPTPAGTETTPYPPAPGPTSTTAPPARDGDPTPHPPDPLDRGGEESSATTRPAQGDSSSGVRPCSHRVIAPHLGSDLYECVEESCCIRFTGLDLAIAQRSGLGTDHAGRHFCPCLGLEVHRRQLECACACHWESQGTFSAEPMVSGGGAYESMKYARYETFLGSRDFSMVWCRDCGSVLPATTEAADRHNSWHLSLERFGWGVRFQEKIPLKESGPAAGNISESITEPCACEGNRGDGERPLTCHCTCHERVVVGLRSKISPERFVVRGNPLCRCRRDDIYLGHNLETCRCRCHQGV